MELDNNQDYKNFVKKRGKRLFKSRPINEVNALRGIFFSFFHHAKRDGRENAAKGYVHLDFNIVSNNPFYGESTVK